jgi:hypothetical protein
MARLPTSCDASVKTFWRGMEVPARKVRAKIAPAPKAWWSMKENRTGDVIDAVATEASDGLILLDDTDGKAWCLVTEQGGASIYGYRRLPATSDIIGDRTD